MTIKVNGRCFNEEFCRRFTESQLREIYKHETTETLDLLIVAVGAGDKKKKEVEDGNGSSIKGKRVSGRKSKG